VSDRGQSNRRFPRLRARCRVELRDRFGTWSAETEDLGPRGCRVVTPRPQTVGALVRLSVRSDLVAAPLEVTGQVVWATSDRPARAGISFAGGAPAPGAFAPGAWFEELSAAERGEGSAAGRPRPPPPGTIVPPPPAGALVPPPPDLAGPAPGLALEVATATLPPRPRPRAKERDPLVARLCDRALELVGVGRGEQAEVLLRRALSLAPGDVEIEAALARLAR
jgi:PilZ domain-containing protein